MSTTEYPTLGEAVTDYLAQRRKQGKADGTMHVDGTLLPRFIRDIGDRQFRHLTNQHVIDWFYGPSGIMDVHATGMQGQETRTKVSPGTHNNYRARLRVFFAWCLSAGYTKVNNYLVGVDPMKLPRKRRQQPKPAVLLQLLDAADCARNRAYIAVAINTALRASEITGITVGDIDFDDNAIFVTVIKTLEEDYQPMTSDLEKELRVWMTEYARLVGRPLRDEDYLFPNRGGCHIATNKVDPTTGRQKPTFTPWVYYPEQRIKRSETIVKDALKKLGLPTHYEGTHTVRRAVARAYFDQLSQETGYESALRTVSALLHHSSIQTTERYLGLSTERERRDKTLKGRPFLTAMVEPVGDNVIPLHRAVS